MNGFPVREWFEGSEEEFNRLSIPLNGFRYYLRKAGLAGVRQLSIPLNGFGRLLEKYPGESDRILSIPLNGFHKSNRL